MRGYLAYVKSIRHLGICTYQCDNRCSVLVFNKDRNHDVFWCENVVKVVKLPYWLVKLIIKWRNV
jgi:hypothetical protein